MFEQLLDLNARAAVEGNYEGAYHLLMAALHWVEHAGEQGALDSLLARARKQAAELEAINPTHHLSRKHAALRGQTALFDSFVTHVDAVRLRMDSVRQRRQRPSSA